MDGVSLSAREPLAGDGGVAAASGGMHRMLEGGYDGFDRILGIAQQHVGVLIEEQRVLHAGVARIAHAALRHHHRARFPYVHDGHAGDGR